MFLVLSAMAIADTLPIEPQYRMYGVCSTYLGLSWVVCGRSEKKNEMDLLLMTF